MAVHHDTLQGAAMCTNHEIVEYYEQLLGSSGLPIASRLLGDEAVFDSGSNGFR